MPASFEKLLSGGDLRSIGNSSAVVKLVKNRNDFENLFACLNHPDRLVVMRAADAIEKITIQDPEFLSGYGKQCLLLSYQAVHKELKWHLAQLLPRCDLSPSQQTKTWLLLSKWALSPDESRIVRVNALQSLYVMQARNKAFEQEWKNLRAVLEKEDVPSIRARLKKLTGR